MRVDNTKMDLREVMRTRPGFRSLGGLVKFGFLFHKKGKKGRII